MSTEATAHAAHGDHSEEAHDHHVCSTKTFVGILLALFFLLRGRIRIEHGWSGTTIERFTSVERIGHWLLAISFIVLALTGLNLLYGREFLIPLVGKEAFATIALAGKLAHNYVAFAFMLESPAPARAAPRRS